MPVPTCSRATPRRSAKLPSLDTADNFVTTAAESNGYIARSAAASMTAASEPRIHQGPRYVAVYE